MKIGTMAPNQVMKQSKSAKTGDKSEHYDVVLLGNTEKEPDFLFNKDLKNLKASGSNCCPSPIEVIGGIGGFILGGAAYLYGGPVLAAIIGGLGGAFAGGTIGEILCERSGLEGKQKIVNTAAGAIVGAGLGVAGSLYGGTMSRFASGMSGAGAIAVGGAVSGMALNNKIGD